MNDAETTDVTVVEQLDGSFRRGDEPRIHLSGDAARDVLDLVGTVGRTAAAAGQTADALFRVAPSEEIARGLADGSLRYATAGSGHASVLIKRADNSHFAGRGDLVKATRWQVLSPVVWQAAAMATQQHYLVNIYNELATMAEGVNEGLAQNRDDRLGKVDQAKRHADRVLEATAAGRAVSPHWVNELFRGTEKSEEAFDQLLSTARREVASFAAGEAGSEGAVEEALQNLLYAFRGLLRCSQAIACLPHCSPDDLQRVVAEEGQRISQAIDRLRGLATELVEADLRVGEKTAAWEAWRERRNTDAARAALGAAIGAAFGGPVGMARGALHGAQFGATEDGPRARRAKRPARPALAPGSTSSVLDLINPPERPLELLVAVREDGDVFVSALPSAAGDPAGEAVAGDAAEETLGGDNPPA